MLQTPYTFGGEPLYNIGANHVDEMIAWVDERTVLLPDVTAADLDPADGSYGLIASLDHHPLHRLFGAERFAAERPVKFALAASYMNFVVSNGVVLVPAFHKPGRDAALAAKDAAFKSIVESRYPGRRVVQIDVDAVTVGGGGMHCITQQIPT